MKTDFQASAAAVPPGSSVNSKKADDPKKIHDAARQFESLLIAQILKAMHASGTSLTGEDEDAASSSALEMAEEEFAKSLSAQGGLGLAKLIESGLQKTQPAKKDVQKL